MLLRHILFFEWEQQREEFENPTYSREDLNHDSDWYLWTILALVGHFLLIVPLSNMLDGKANSYHQVISCLGCAKH